VLLNNILMSSLILYNLLLDLYVEYFLNGCDVQAEQFVQTNVQFHLHPSRTSNHNLSKCLKPFNLVIFTMFYLFFDSGLNQVKQSAPCCKFHDNHHGFFMCKTVTVFDYVGMVKHWKNLFWKDIEVMWNWLVNDTINALHFIARYNLYV